MVRTRKNRQSLLLAKRSLFRQLVDFDQDPTIGDGADNGQQIVVVHEGTVERDFTATSSGCSSAANENTMNVQALEKCFNENFDREMGNIVDTVEEKIQNAVLTAIDKIITPRIESAVRSINASSGQKAASVTGISDGGGRHRDYYLFRKRI